MRKSSNDIPFKDLLRFSLPFKWSIISKYFDFDRDVGFFFGILLGTHSILIGSYWELTLKVYGDWVKEEMCLHADINLAQSLVEIHLTIKYLLLFQPIRIGWRFLDTVVHCICWLLILCYLLNMLFVRVIRRALGHFVLCVVSYFPWCWPDDLMCKYDTVVLNRWFKF